MTDFITVTGCRIQVLPAHEEMAGDVLLRLSMADERDRREAEVLLTESEWALIAEARGGSYVEIPKPLNLNPYRGSGAATLEDADRYRIEHNKVSGRYRVRRGSWISPQYRTRRAAKRDLERRKQREAEMDGWHSE